MVHTDCGSSMYTTNNQVSFIDLHDDPLGWKNSAGKGIEESLLSFTCEE